MRVLRLSTQLHKWLALIVGLQVLFWVGGGLVMTAIPIETVRGEHRVRATTPSPLPPELLATLGAPAAPPGLSWSRVELRSTPRGPAWTLTPLRGEPRITSAVTGRPFADMSQAEARTLAAAAYAGDSSISAVERLAEAPPETGRDGPIWRVDFADREGTTFYLAPETGEVVTRRSGVWRFYDVFWRLHVMDWTHGENFNHPLIVVTTVLTLIVVISGLVLLWIRLSRDLNMARAARRSRAARTGSPSDPA